MQANVCFAPLLLENDPLLTFSEIFISRFLNEAKVFLQSNVNRTALLGYLFLQSQTMAVVSPPVKAQQFQPTAPVAGRAQIASRGPPGPSGLSEPLEVANVDPLIGRKVRTRWTEDNNFYVVVIIDYNPQQVGSHC